MVSEGNFINFFYQIKFLSIPSFVVMDVAANSRPTSSGRPHHLHSFNAFTSHINIFCYIWIIISISACIIMNKNKRNELNDLSFLCMNNQSLRFAEDRSFIKIFGKKYLMHYMQNVLIWKQRS